MQGTSKTKFPKYSEALVFNNLINLPTTKTSSLEITSEAITTSIPSLSEVDLCVESLEKEDFCDRHLIIHKTNVETIDLNNDEFSRFEDYMKKEIHLICNKVPKELKVNPPKPSDLKITITVEEILGIFGYKKGNEKDIFSCIGSGAFHFLPENVIDEFLTNVKVTKEKSLKNFIPETLLKKCYEEMKMQPDDVDYRIDLSDSYLTIDEELKKIIDHLAKKMEDQEKEGKINKTWAQFTYKTHLGKKLSSNSPNFWEEFINGLFFTKKNFSKYDAPVQFAIVRIIGNEGEKIEFILKKRMPRSCIYTSRAPVISLQNKQIKLEKDEGNPFNYTLQQCLIDKIFNIIRPMQKNWNVHNKNKFVYDPKDFVYLLTNKSKNEKYLGSDDVEEDKFNALIQSGNNPAQALISALKDAIKNHLKKRKEAFIPLLFNAYHTVQKFDKKELWKKLTKSILEKIKNTKLTHQVEILRSMIEKEIPFSLISAYLQLIGFIDLCLVEKTSSCFTTLRHGKQIHLQVTLDSKDTILLPFDIENSLTLLNENKAIFEQYNLFNLFTNYKFFNTRNCNFSNISKIYSLLEDKIQTISTSLYESTQKDLKIYGVILKTLPWNYKLSENYQNLFISLPSVKKDDPHKEVLLPALKSYYQLDEQTLKSIIKSVEKGIEGEKWKNFILYLNTVPSLQNFSWLSLKQFLKLISTNNDKKNIGKEIGIKNNLFDPLLKSWAVSKHGKRISQLLSMKEVQIYYTMPLEKLHHFLAAYKISKEKNEDVNKLSEQILLECAKDSIQKNPQNLKNLPLDLFKDIALHFFENGNIEKSIVITDLLSIIESSLWKNFFSSLVENNDSNHLRKVISWWRYSIQIPKTELVNTILTLLEKIHHHYEEDFKVVCLELIEKLKDYNLNENQEKRLAPFIVEKFAIEVSKLAKRDFNLENKIDSSLASLEDKIDLYLKILSVYAKLENKESFFSFFLFLDKNYKEYLTNSTSLIDILLPLISIFNHKQRLKLLEYDFLLSNPKIINNILTLLNDDNLGTFQKEELLAASLKHPKLMYSNIERWITTILNRSQNTSSTKTLTLPSVSIGYILRHHLNNILDHLIVSDNYLKAIQLIVMTNTYQITLKEIPTKTLNRLIDLIILEKNPSQFLSLFWSFSSSLRSQALKNSIKDSLLNLNDFLAKNFINLNELPAAQQAINRILDLDPSCIENCENAITKLWSSKLEEEKNIELWSSWFQKIKKEKIWICHQLNYCQALEEYCGPEACLEAIKELDYQIEDERFILFINKKASEQASHRTPHLTRQWISWFFLKNLQHLDVVPQLLMIGLSNPEKSLFFESVTKLTEFQLNKICSSSAISKEINYKDFIAEGFIKNFLTHASNESIHLFFHHFNFAFFFEKGFFSQQNLLDLLEGLSLQFQENNDAPEMHNFIERLHAYCEKELSSFHSKSEILMITYFQKQKKLNLAYPCVKNLITNISNLPTFPQEAVDVLLNYLQEMLKVDISALPKNFHEEMIGLFINLKNVKSNGCEDAYTAHLFTLLIISSDYLNKVCLDPLHTQNENYSEMHSLFFGSFVFIISYPEYRSSKINLSPLQKIVVEKSSVYIFRELGNPLTFNLTAFITMEISKNSAQINHFFGDKFEAHIKISNWQLTLNRSYVFDSLPVWMKNIEQFIDDLPTILKHADNDKIFHIVCFFYGNWNMCFTKQKAKITFINDCKGFLKKFTLFYDEQYGHNWYLILVTVFIRDILKPLSKKVFELDAKIAYFEILADIIENIQNTEVKEECLKRIFETLLYLDLEVFTILLKTFSKININNSIGFATTLSFLKKSDILIPSLLVKEFSSEELSIICESLLKVKTTTSLLLVITLCEEAMKNGIFLRSANKNPTFYQLTESLAYGTNKWIVKNNNKGVLFSELWVRYETLLYQSIAFIEKQENSNIEEDIFNFLQPIITNMCIIHKEFGSYDKLKLNLDHVILYHKLYEIITGVVKKSKDHLKKPEILIEIAIELSFILDSFLVFFAKYNIKTKAQKIKQEFSIFMKDTTSSTFKENPGQFWIFLMKNLFTDRPLTCNEFLTNDSSNICQFTVRPAHFCYIDFLKPVFDLKNVDKKIDHYQMRGASIIKTIFFNFIQTAKNTCPPRISHDISEKDEIFAYLEGEQKKKNVYSNSIKSNETSIIQIELGYNKLFINVAEKLAKKAKESKMITENGYLSWMSNIYKK